MREALRWGVVALALALMGCAGNPPASQSNEQAAKRHAADPARAGVYVYRDERFGGDIPMEVMLDGVPVGRTLGHTFFFVEVPPGEHRVSSTYGRDAALELEMEAGELYYLWQEVTVGADGVRSQLHRVDPEVGREAVARCRMLDAW